MRPRYKVPMCAWSKLLRTSFCLIVALVGGVIEMFQLPEVCPLSIWTAKLLNRMNLPSGKSFSASLKLQLPSSEVPCKVSILRRRQRLNERVTTCCSSKNDANQVLVS